MNLQQILQALQGIFQKELTDGKKRHIVFWYDPEGEFVEDIDHLNLEGVRVLKLHDHNAFRTKYEIEKVDPNSHFLVYSNQSKPSPRQNWLIDTLKYSVEFSTDKSSIIMQDLGIDDESLRPVFKRYLKFFNNKERYAKFAAYEVDRWTEEKVHLAVLATLCKVDILNLDEILKSLLIEELNKENKYWQAIQKFGDEQAFWSLVEKYYGFTRENKSLKQLMISLMITHLADGLNTAVPQEWKSYLLSMGTNSLVFINQFIHHSQDHVYFDRWAVIIQDELNLNKYLTEWKTDDFIHCDTFPLFDHYFIQSIVQHLTELVQDFDSYRQIITARRKLHWFNRYKYEYETLLWAVTLLETFNRCKNKLKQKQANELFEDYVSEFYLLDQAYRKFYVAYDQISYQELFFPLKELIENTYVNGFLEELSIYWSNAVHEKLSNHWPLPGIAQQKEFFREFVQPFVNRDERVFVIISDALRFEIAQELCDRLNHERKGIADILAIQGVVPSFTALGMAALLPYKSLTYDSGLNISIDGQSTSGIAQREKILQAKVRDAIAISFSDVKGMKRDQLRKTIQGKKVIYIYHNTIDARGDHAATEHEVFQAAEEAIMELSQLINHLVNNVSATYIYITADHGFIYKRSRLQEADKTARLTEIGDLEKRRFIISDQFVERSDTLTISLDYIFGENSGKYVVTPRGTMRYRRQGEGANYIHGGAMLQEIVVPVIKYKNDRSDSQQNEVRKVQVKLTSISRKITSMITYLEFFQTEKVEHKKLPLRLKLYFVDEEGQRISNENIIIADSQSEQPLERTYKEKFVLKNMKYDKTKNYYLILEDEDQDVDKIYDKIPFIIDIAFSDDFGF